MERPIVTRVNIDWLEWRLFSTKEADRRFHNALVDMQGQKVKIEISENKDRIIIGLAD